VSDDRARTSIHLLYVWIDPADPAPAEILGSLLPAFDAVGMTDCRFEVKTQGPPSITTSYDNFAAWLEALRENAPIREALCLGRLGAGGSNVWLDLDTDRGLFTLDYTGPVSEVDRLTAVIPSSPFAAHFRALPERDAFFDQSEQFAAQESITPERMADAVSALRATAWLPRFEGHIERKGVRRVKRSLPEFLDLLGGGMVHGAGSTHVGLSSEGLNVDVHAGPDGSVEIHVRAFDQGLGELLMATAREALALTTTPEGEVHLAGEVRTYSFRTPPTPAGLTAR